MEKMDCHIHMVLDGVDWKKAVGRHQSQVDEGRVRSVLAAYQAAGYTYLRDGGDKWGAGRRAKELAAGYGIQYRSPLYPLCKAGHYGSFIGVPFQNLGEFSRHVASIRDKGGDFIKIMISGLMGFDCFGRLTEEPLPADEIKALIHITHEEGMQVMVHANGARTVETAAAAGAASIEHGAYLDGDALAAMLEMGTIWVPTLSPVANLRGTGRFREDMVQQILESATENVARFAEMGGTIAPGSDAGAWMVPHGGSSEYDLLEEVLPQETIRQGARAIMAKF